MRLAIATTWILITSVANAQPARPPVLSLDDQALLAMGEISDIRHVGGALASVVFGFGSGQAVQGRWSSTGWIFTLGETASVTAVVVGAVTSLGRDDCFDKDGCSFTFREGLVVGGLVGVLVFRLAGMFDAFSGPPRHNRRVRELKVRLGIPTHTSQITPYVNKARDRGGIAGVAWSF